MPLVNHGRYPEAIRIVQILTVYAAALYLVLPAPSLLMARYRYALLATIAVAEVTSDVVADIIAAPVWGLVGVTISATVVNVVFCVIIVLATFYAAEDKSRAASAVPA
jgi:hypothetical protein